MLAAVLASIALAALPDPVPADPCASRKPGTGIAAFVVVAPQPGAGAGSARGAQAAGRDTVVRATVCVVPARSDTRRIGSYHGELLFDSTAARVLGVVKPRDGMRVENTKPEGRVRFAGAEPGGFTDGTLLTVLLRVAAPGVSPRLRLQMHELNGTDGSDLMKQLDTSSAHQP